MNDPRSYRHVMQALAANGANNAHLSRTDVVRVVRLPKHGDVEHHLDPGLLGWMPRRCSIVLSWARKQKSKKIQPGDMPRTQ